MPCYLRRSARNRTTQNGRSDALWTIHSSSWAVHGLSPKHCFMRFMAGLTCAPALRNKILGKNQSKRLVLPEKKRISLAEYLTQDNISLSILFLLRGTGWYEINSDSRRDQFGCALVQAHIVKSSYPAVCLCRTCNVNKTKLATSIRKLPADLFQVTHLCPYLEGTIRSSLKDQEMAR